MIDRLFFATLTFCILAGGTVAVGSAMMEHDQQAAAVRAVSAARAPAATAAVPVARSERSQSAQDTVQ